jgi:hypothetical protein
LENISSTDGINNIAKNRTISNYPIALIATSIIGMLLLIIIYLQLSIFKPLDKNTQNEESASPTLDISPVPEITIQKAEYKGYKILQTTDLNTSNPINILDGNDRLIATFDYQLPLSKIIKIGDYFYLITEMYGYGQPLYRIKFPFENSQLEEVYSEVDGETNFPQIVKFSNKYWIHVGYGETCGGFDKYIEYDPLTNEKGKEFSSTYGCGSDGEELLGVYNNKFLSIDQLVKPHPGGIAQEEYVYRALFLKDFANDNKEVLLSAKNFPEGTSSLVYDPKNAFVYFLNNNSKLFKYDLKTREIKLMYEFQKDEEVIYYYISFNKDSNKVCLNPQIDSNLVADYENKINLLTYQIDPSGVVQPQQGGEDSCELYNPEELFGYQQVDKETIVFD